MLAGQTVVCTQTLAVSSGVEIVLKCALVTTHSDSSLIVILVMIKEDCAMLHVSYHIDIPFLFAQCSKAKHGKDGMG